MPERTVSPYGSWASPIGPEMLLKGTVHMRNQMVRWDGMDFDAADAARAAASRE